MKTILTIAILMFPWFSQADVKVSPIFADHMILQEGVPWKVWGTADPGEEVTVSAADRSGKTSADASGKWQVTLEPLQAGGQPFEVRIDGKNSIVLKDVLAGDVWICSGQSNMGFLLNNAIGAEKEIATSANPRLRQFRIKSAVSSKPLDDYEGVWTTAGPETSGEFTAVGYFFGKTLEATLRKPVGLIFTAWGGTPLEAWTSAESLDRDPDLKAARHRLLADAASYPARHQEFQKAHAAWVEKYKRQDPGNPDPSSFAAPEIETSDWKTITLPGPFSQAGVDAGVIWLRKNVKVPEVIANQALRLDLGKISGFDTVYWNGGEVGETTPQSGGALGGRVYHVPAELVKPGEGVLAIRVFQPVAGAKHENPNIFRAGTMYLDGEWLAKAETSFPAVDAAAVAEYPEIPSEPSAVHNLPAYLYNAMIHPLIPFAVKGAIWYQGESNTGRAWQYRTTFPLLIEGWRRNWPDLPFYFCQLANNRPKTDQPVTGNWPELREAQAQALSLPETGMAVLIDLGEADDIHPRNKEDVGERLARVALAKTYGEKLPWSGPVYRSMRIEGNSVRITFDHAEGLMAKPLGNTYVSRSLTAETKPLVLPSPESELQGFAVCGEDRQWKWGQAKIEKDTVVVSSPEVPRPIAVRYAWADNPTCNLYNAAGLPAAPFRTDDFPALTSGAKL